MIAALYIQTNIITMKKILLMAILAGFTYFGAAAQDAPGNSSYGHSHKKAKKANKVKKPYTVSNSTAAQRKAANVQHKTTISTIKDNDLLTNEQQREKVKQANTTHKQQMRTVSTNKATGKKK